ncbi:MAG TPA: RNA polymerase subunit sigma-70, partial [Lentzea sp.]
LHEDATMSMPPFAWWLHGREQIAQALRDPAAACADAWLVPVAANGSPAYWQMRPGRPDPFALVFLDVRDGSVTGSTTFLDPSPLLPLFPSVSRSQVVHRPPTR